VTGSGFSRIWALCIFSLIISPPSTFAEITVAPTALGFGNVSVGSSRTQTVTITNAGYRTVSVSRAGVSGTGFSIQGLTFPFYLAAGKSAILSVIFAPPTAGTDTGSVWVSASTTSWKRYRRSTATVALTGAGVASGAGQITASPAALTFGSLSVGQSQSLSATVTNTGTANVTVSQASSSSAAFAVSGLTLPASVSAGHSLTFSVVFRPTASGAVSGQLAITSNASNPQLNIAVSGSGASAGQLTVAPGTLNFGNVATGSGTALAGTLTATSSPVTVSSASSSSAEFVVSGISLPVTVPAGQSLPFTVTFRPQASGTATASLSFLSNATSSPTTEMLTGSGTGAVQHTVSLSWSPSSSSGVVGYNLYRGTVPGGPYTQIVSRDSTSAYSDNTVVGGQTYFYVVTSVDGTGAESVYSNQAQAVVPTP
jgi:hypothetical protein